MNWTFAINKDSYFEIRDNDEIKWNSAKEVKKGNIICVYTGKPYSEIGFIFKAKTDLFEDEQIRRDWNKPAILVNNKIIIQNPISIKELRENPILSQWGAVRRNFMGSHFKMSDEEWNELKRIILEKNPELENDIINLENEGIYPENKPRVWKIAPGKQWKRNKIWPTFVERGYIGVGWFGCKSFEKRSYSQFNSYETLKEELRKCANTPVVGNNANMIWNFGKEIKIGDIVVANNGLNGIWGIGIIKSDYIPPSKSIRLNIDEDKEYFHFREVDWLITEPMEINEDYFFAQQTITEINQDKWNKIKETYIGKSWSYEKTFERIESYWHGTGEDPCEPINIIKTLYEEYQNEFYSIEEGPKHLLKYDIERQKVKEYYELIGNDPEAKFDIEDPPINHLLPIKEPAVAPVAVGTIKAYNYTDEQLPGLTETVYNLIQNLIEIDDKTKQQELINDFKSGPYKTGFRTAALTPVLYYLDPKFLFINSKTVDSFKFISNILGNNEWISVELFDYIKNNEKLKKLIDFLSNYIPNLNFENFDIFCHWLCSDNLGNYARDPEKYNDWLTDQCPSKPPAAGNIKDSLEFILNNYKLAKDKNQNQENVLNVLNDILPNYLEEKTNGLYEIFSSGQDKWHFCPYVALMDEKITNKPTEGFYINYMFREDMSGVYLAIRQGVSEIKKDKGIESLEILESRANNYRNRIKEPTDFIDEFSNSIDLKRKNAEYAPFYEAGNICSKLYLKDDLPSEEELESDLKNIIELYDMLNESGPDENFLEYLNKKGFYFEHDLIENFLLSLKVKPFLILTGNSGTGKTKIAQLFAQYISNSKNETSSIITEVKVGKAAKNGVWTLNKTVLDELSVPNYDGSYDITIDGIESKGNFHMLSQLFYKDKENKIKSRLEEIANKNPEQKVSLKILLPSDNNSQYKIVPIGANWTENRHIVGFFNVITEKYQRTKALDLIINSQNDSINPYFLILDEMNLSHVERYFSDFLSAMESKETVELHLSKDIKDVPNEIKFYDNLFVIGTVNVDETTYMFSPKVLDRANTIEFLTPSAMSYMDGNKIAESLNGDLNYLEDPLSDIDIRNKSLSKLKELFGEVNTSEGKFWDLIAEQLEEFQNELKKVKFDFGFRVINEIMRFMYVSWVYEGKSSEWNNWQRYFDAQIKQKMLPRIHGSQRTLENTLDSLLDLCENYPTSKAKLEEMNDVLKKQRYVSFTN